MQSLLHAGTIHGISSRDLNSIFHTIREYPLEQELLSQKSTMLAPKSYDPGFKISASSSCGSHAGRAAVSVLRV